MVDGVTGSGKTEVYLRAIRHALELGRGAIVLVPEIALTPQTVSRFEGRFGDTVAVMHSRMTAGERFDQWEAVHLGKTARVVVGASSALFMSLWQRLVSSLSTKSTKVPISRKARRATTRAMWPHGWLSAQAPRLCWAARPLRSRRCAACEGRRYVASRGTCPTRANGKPMPEVRIIDMAKRIRPWFSFHVRQRAAGKPVRRGRCGPQSRAHAQPARIRELLAVSRLRLCARMHYVFGFADLSRSGPN